MSRLALALGAAAVVAAVALRCAGLEYGLPHVYNADEPHLVNLAVSFGRGSLNPYSFKYPTLWPTALFGAYGVFFAAWSGLTIKKSVADFIALFAWDPTTFYLIARSLSVAFAFGAAAATAVAGRALFSGGLWFAGALLLLFSPEVNISAHSAKPDCAMLFFAACAWYFAVKLCEEDRRERHWACGLSIGLALSTQYTAIGACPLLVLAALSHWTKERKPSFRWLAEGIAAAVIGLFAGSPYILLNFGRFLASLRDLKTLQDAALIDSQVNLLSRVAENLLTFAGDPLGGLLALAGCAALVTAGRKRVAIAALGTIAFNAAFLVNHPDGGSPRYLFASFPGLALLSTAGLELVSARCKKTAAVLLVACAAAGAWGSWLFDREILLPDTRAEAARWIESNVPQGAGLLVDQAHISPLLVFSQDQLEELAAQSRAASSPRARLFAAMKDRHPGGGYRVFRVLRGALDLRTNPSLVKQSQADSPMLDVHEGLAAARRAGVKFVVTSSHGAKASRAPELSSFFRELCAEGEIVAEFAPVAGQSTGPVLRVIKI
jgi:hypothetical protein